MIIRGRDITGDRTETADVCVVGSGAGGAVAAKELAEAGRSVVVLEAGPHHDPSEFTGNEKDMLPLLFWDAGMRGTDDGSVLVYQGRGLGGSTVHNLCYAVRTPDAILNWWGSAFGVHDLAPSDLAPSLDRVEAALGVNQIQEEGVNNLNRLIRQGCRELGWSGLVQRHNRGPCPDCSAACVLGCPNSGPDSGKQSMAVTYLPRALDLGARVYTDCLATAVLTEGDGVVGVEGRFLSPEGRSIGRLTVRSQAVVLASGAVNSPQVWLNSRLPDPWSQVGRNLHLHPAVFVGAVFPEPVDAYRGMPHSFYVDQFLDLERDPQGGYVLMPIFGPPVMVAAAVPSFGREHRELMDQYRHMGAMLVLLHDSSAGRVTVDRHGDPVIRYRLNTVDRERLVEGLERCAELLFAAGAEKVILPCNQRVVIERGDGLEAIRRRGIVENDILMASSHPQGTLRMGEDPRRSVVDSYGQAHTVKGLHVADASLFPGSVAVPPTLTIAALADRVARRLARDWPP